MLKNKSIEEIKVIKTISMTTLLLETMKKKNNLFGIY